jgi:hypothetical protein
MCNNNSSDESMLELFTKYDNEYNIAPTTGDQQVRKL